LAKLLLAFARIVILGFSLLEINGQDLYSLLNMCLLFDGGGVRVPDSLYDRWVTARQFVLVPSPLRISAHRRSRTYVTIDGQSVSLSWCQVRI
jgi:hypothetical protein